MHDKLKKYPNILKPVDIDDRISLVKTMSDISEEYGMKLNSCCTGLDLSGYGVGSSGCIDGRMLSSLGIPFEEASVPLRKDCRCVKNIDIGEYDTCNHDCIYCYANRNTDIKRKRREYSPDSEMLSGHVTKYDRIVELSSRSVLKITDF